MAFDEWLVLVSQKWDSTMFLQLLEVLFLRKFSVPHKSFKRPTLFSFIFPLVSVSRQRNLLKFFYGGVNWFYYVPIFHFLIKSICHALKLPHFPLFKNFEEFVLAWFFLMSYLLTLYKYILFAMGDCELIKTTKNMGKISFKKTSHVKKVWNN